MAEATWQAIKRVIEPVVKRLAEAEQEVRDLKATVKALEAQPPVKYCGTWHAGQAYSAGSLVTKNGGLWCAMRSRPDAPGVANSGWLLCVKSGTAVKADHQENALPVVEVRPPALPVVSVRPQRRALPVVNVGAQR